MAKKGSIQRFTERFAPLDETATYSLGGFITQDGNIIPAYGNHEAMAQVVRTTVKNLIQAGMVRYHVTDKNRYGTSIGIDAPRSDKITTKQLVKIGLVLRRYHPAIVSVQQIGRRFQQFGDAFTDARSAKPLAVVKSLKGGRHATVT